MTHLDPDQIVLLALGEDPTADDAAGPSVGGTAAETRAHLRDCAVCRHELAQLSRTVELAREAGELGLQTPVVLPGSLWNGIAAELGIGAPGPSGADPQIPARREPQPVAVEPLLPKVAERGRVANGRRVPAGPGSPGRRPSRSWRRALIAAAVVVAAGGGVTAGVAIGGNRNSGQASTQSQALLKAMPAAPAGAHGTATVTQTAAGLTLNVAARQLPLRQGYYEVWLYNPTADQMVAVGTLGAGGDGVWTLASTIDLRSYSVVDVSAQNFDGNPAHRDSVLQGPLTQ